MVLMVVSPISPVKVPALMVLVCSSPVAILADMVQAAETLTEAVAEEVVVMGSAETRVDIRVKPDTVVASSSTPKVAKTVLPQL